MKFVYTKGEYATYRGRVFAYGKPTDIQDRGTIAALLKHPDYRKVDDEAQKTEAAPTVLTIPQPDPDACPKCGKVFRQGRYIHIKHCKGRA